MLSEKEFAAQQAELLRAYIEKNGLLEINWNDVQKSEVGRGYYYARPMWDMVIEVEFINFGREALTVSDGSNIRLGVKFNHEDQPRPELHGYFPLEVSSLYDHDPQAKLYKKKG